MLVKLNLSGHKNAALEEQGFTFPGTLQVDLADPELPEKLANFLSKYVSSGDIVVMALPGLAPLAALVITIVHGLSGSFPRIVPLIRGESGFIPGEPIDLQQLRNDIARASRENIIKL